MRRQALSLVGLAAVLTVAYWFDRSVIPRLRQETGSSFNPAPQAWTMLVADIAIAFAVLGLVWMLFRWAPPSRLVGAAYLVVGLALAAAWPIALGFFMNRTLSLPVFDQLGLWFVLGEGGLLDLIVPFIVAIGLVRLVLPLPSGWRRAPAHDPASLDLPARP